MSFFLFEMLKDFFSSRLATIWLTFQIIFFFSPPRVVVTPLPQILVAAN
jgi:hypothetical protein